MKLGIDIGNYQVKTSEGIIFDSKITPATEFGTDKDRLFYDGNEYFVGEGEFETEYRKFDKANFIPLLLTAIYKSSRENDIDLALGLPISQFKNKKIKQDLITMLAGRSFVFELNDCTRFVTINSVQIFPEGISGFLYLMQTDLNLRSLVGRRDAVLIDVGGATTDIALIVNNSAKQPTSIAKGTINVYDIIEKELSEKYYDAKIQKEKIQHYLDYGFYYKGQKQDISFAINKTVKIFKEVYSELKMNYPIYTEAVIVMGGGAKIFGEAFSSTIPDIIVRDDIEKDVFANAKAYKMLFK